MFYFVSILILITCILLILIVLVQNSKGGGLASNFQSSNQVMGVRKTTDFLEKATWTLAAVLLVLSIAASATITTDEEIQQGSAIESQIEQAIEVNSSQNFPTATPMEEGNATEQTEGEEDNQ